MSIHRFPIFQHYYNYQKFYKKIINFLKKTNFKITNCGTSINGTRNCSASKYFQEIFFWLADPLGRHFCCLKYVLNVSFKFFHLFLHSKSNKYIIILIQNWAGNKKSSQPKKAYRDGTSLALDVTNKHTRDHKKG